MNKNQLFRSTRVRLALCYATVMGLILSISAFGFYKVVFNAHVVALDSEIESVAGTLHDTLEPKLKEPGKLEPTVQQLFSNISLCENTEAKCIQQKFHDARHFIGVTNHGNYYVRFFDLSGRLIATAGSYPEEISTVFSNQKWQFIKNGKGEDYHQITVGLHVINNRNTKDWGYIQVGRSLREFNRYLDSVKMVLALGLPITMGIVTLASWWLAGLAMRPIYDSYRQIQQFTTDAAHELRTPLAATGATIESGLLMPHIEQEETRDILRTLLRQNQRLTTLVTDLLMLARLDTQPIPKQQELCCLNDIISDLIEEFEAIAIAVGISLECSLQVNHPLNIVGDLDQLYRLVSNLIINAINYTPKGGLVKVFLNRNDYYAVIKVQDTGIGIAANEQKRIFDRFYRVSSDRSRSTGGSGLGLAIAQAIVRAHQGSLNVESELGKGSIFTIQLPLNITRVKNVRSIKPSKWLRRALHKLGNHGI
jgi:signal transduction histidine kinase